jgi:hypothetical protein
MSDRETLPINHSTASHVTHVAGGAVGGGLKGMLTGALTGWGLLTAATAVTAGFLLSGAAAFSVGAALLVGSSVAIGVPLLAITPAAPIVLAVLAPFTAIGTAIGSIGGGVRGHHQVQRDRAAAHMVDAEVGAMQAQAVAMQAQAQMLAHTRPGDRYAGASTMIQTRDTQLDAATAASQGMVGAPQLEAARG